MNTMKFYGVVSSALVFSLSAYAASMKNIDEDNVNQHIQISSQFQQALQGIHSNDTFRVSAEVTLDNGLIKNKYTQYYKGVPVFNGVLTNSLIDDETHDWFGSILTGIDEDIKNVKPSLDKNAVLALAKNQFKATKGLKALPTELILNDEATLYVRINDKQKAELIYMVNFYVEDEASPSRPYFIIDAHSGKIKESWEGLTTRAAEGPGGNLKTGSYYYGRDYPSLEVSDNCSMVTQFVETYDMKHGTGNGVGAPFQFNCPVNNYKSINGAFSPLNDGHYFANIIYNMYQTWYKFDPLAGKLRVRVHFGNNLEQAFWNGQFMTFGDGGSSLYPLTTLDIMGHEVSHGVTEKTSGLIYKEQSGGINEAFSDMAGETAEAFRGKAVGKENDWLGGADVMKNQEAMRYFKNPKLDGVSIAHASEYNKGLDVHFSSGVYNKAFYTLSTKPNWGIQKAFGVFLTANRVYWTKDATFNSAACGVSKAAKDMGYEVADVISSFNVVGVDAKCGVNPDPTPTPGGEMVLTNGSVVNNLKVLAASEHRFVIKVPVLPIFPYSYDLLFIRAYNPSGTAGNSAELYVRYDNGINLKVEPQKMDQAAGNNDEFFLINKPAAGDYHILLKGKAVDTLTLSAFYGNNAK